MMSRVVSILMLSALVARADNPNMLCSVSVPVAEAGSTAELTAFHKAPKGAKVKYLWKVTGGKVTQTAAGYVWNLTGLAEDDYTAEVRATVGGKVDPDPCALSIRVTAPGPVVKRAIGDKMNGTVPGFLVNGQYRTADLSFGRYSYVLMRNSPDNDADLKERQNAIFREVLHQLGPQYSLFTKGVLAANRLNSLWLPVSEAPPAGFDAERKLDEATQWLAKYYDYGRAQELLRKFGLDTGNTREIYLVTADKAVLPDSSDPKNVPDLKQMLAQEMTAVPAKVASQWIASFVHQSEQINFRSADAMETLAKKMYLWIDSLTDAMGVVAEAMPKASAIVYGKK